MDNFIKEKQTNDFLRAFAPPALSSLSVLAPTPRFAETMPSGLWKLQKIIYSLFGEEEDESIPGTEEAPAGMVPGIG